VYKLLLCWRYLKTRYLALACVISVMLGVATLIVVNSVMSGFSTKLKDRLRGNISEIIIESVSLDGFGDPEGKMQRIRASPIGHHIEAMTATAEVFAILQFEGRIKSPCGNFYRDIGTVTRYVKLIGIDPKSYCKVGGFAQYLLEPERKSAPSFELSADAALRYFQNHPPFVDEIRLELPPPPPGSPPPPSPPPSRPKIAKGIIPGNALVSYRHPKHKPGTPVEDIYMVERGQDIRITTVSAAAVNHSGEQRMGPVQDRFVACDFFKSEMAEYDSSFVFVPLDYLQHLRSMGDRVTSIQIKLQDYAHAPEVVAVLKELFPRTGDPREDYLVQTWEDKQGALLAAIAIERGLLNVLLFLIIAVAGFGILAIFSMIVVEKTRDIGIIKALGASNTGVMGIFLGYGLLLGLVGAGLGTGLGLTITTYINEIEKVIGNATGHEIFSKGVYYFDKIPTDIQPMTVLLVNAGALGIVVLSSILPALRAALLHPVRALRYE